MIEVECKNHRIYDWFDIQEAMCEVMGIPVEKFCSLHTIDPDLQEEYTDGWQICLDHIVPDRMNNDTYVDLFAPDEEAIIIAADKPNPWEACVLSAFAVVMRELLKGNKDSFPSVIVNFSW